MQHTEMLTTSEVAARLGVTSNTVRQLAKSGALPCVRVTAKCYRFPAAGLADFVAARSTGNVAP